MIWLSLHTSVHRLLVDLCNIIRGSLHLAVAIGKGRRATEDGMLRLSLYRRVGRLITVSRFIAVVVGGGGGGGGGGVVAVSFVGKERRATKRCVSGLPFCRGMLRGIGGLHGD